MKQLMIGMALIVAVALMPSASAQTNYGNNYSPQLLKCESIDSNTRYCDADTRDGVRLARQLSKTRCIEGQNWGYDDRGIWVDGGCRAEFEVGYSRQYGWQQGGGRGQTIRCESYGSRPNYCNADTRFGVVLVQQLSDKKCIEGRSWGADTRGVWVNDGCRGEFEIGGRGWENQQFQVVRCESVDTREKLCPLDGRYNRIRLVKQLSRSQCTQGQTWGSDNRGIWVSQGCRATFEVSRTYAQDRGNTVRCQSDGSRTRYCDVDTRGGVQLIRELSSSRCAQGQTWGWDNRGIWVTRGCDAEFEVGAGVGNGYSNSGYGNPNPYPNNGYGNNGYGNGTGQQLTCESQDGRYNFCSVGSANVREVRIERQISKTPCRQNDNWGFRNDGVWVNGGCRAAFRVY
jgi:Protein of unknown function (DUF3011)